jgi:predicted regulator of Ras-like GTPase activity (Roadblock/LC7/MglB family)
MVSKAAVIWQALLLSAAISVFPLILYPATFGLPPLSLHPLYAFAEWGLYFLLYLALRVTLPLHRKALAAGVVVLFRLSIGVVLGTLVWFMQGIPLETAIPQCLWTYPPAYVMHIIFAPFVLMPLFNRVWARGFRFSIDSRQTRGAGPAAGGFSFPSQAAARIPVRGAGDNDELSFDAACAWVGEYSGVRMSILVDADGLVVAKWTRQKYTRDAEYWAAVVIEMVRFHQRCPRGADPVDVQRLELETVTGRLMIRRTGPLWFAVQTEAHAGELVQVRIAQATEMIEKHYHDRYSANRPAGLEVSHV